MIYPHKNSQTVKNGAAYIAIVLVINMCSWEHADNWELGQIKMYAMQRSSTHSNLKLCKETTACV